MNKARIQIARPDIVRYFDELPEKVHRRLDIARHLAKERSFWRLTQGTTTEGFIKFLLGSTKLAKVVFPFPRPYKREVRYVWGDVPMHQVMLSLKRGCYFSHYTAVKLHGLTEQSPTTTYLNDEQRQESMLMGSITQEAVDRAFRRPVRVSRNVAETDSFRVCIINGKNTQRLGVIEKPTTDEKGEFLGKLRFTNLERTLIDIAVRPVYSGGPTEVLKAYAQARDTTVSVNRLAAMLKKLAYIYPYQQVIGFYLERAGYRSSLLDLFRTDPMELDFYLMHDMKRTDYVKQWRLHIPKGF